MVLRYWFGLTTLVYYGNIYNMNTLDDMWHNRVMFGDCLELMVDIPDGSIDMILADLPYGTTACKWDTIIPFEPLWAQYERIIKPNGAIVLTATQPFTSALVMSNATMFKYSWVWIKPQGVDPFMSKIRPLNNIEDVLVFAKKSPVYYPQMEAGTPYHIVRDKKPRKLETTGTTMRQTETTNMGVRYPKRTLNVKQEQGAHPTQKPTDLFRYLIRTYTKVGDTVLDNVAGSGTTAIACLHEKRNFIVMEKEPKYYQAILDRIKEFEGA